MENLLHSLQHSKLPKKPAHAPKSIYDDVFGGPPKYGGVPTLSPRVEDYGEIFGGFRTPRSSAIPVLDLPVVNGPDMFFDVRSSEFDYSEVFGQCEGLDFADAGEVLFGRQSNGGDYGSSDEAWTPEASEYLSEESEHSENNHYFETGDGYYPVDNNVSYNRANSRCNSEIPNGIRHAAQIHSVPGFSYFVDQRAKVQNQADSNPSAWHAHDSSRDLYFGREMAKAKGRHLKKTVSNLSDTKTFRESYENDVRPQRVYRRRNSCPRETFVTISEVSLRTEPSNVPPPLRPAPALDIKVGDAGGLGSSWKGISPEGAEFDDSPRFFDVEIDASSSAAAEAAAAMKEVMEQAQAKLKSAKELMEQKKEFALDHIKVVSRDDSKKLSRRLSKIVDGVNSSRKIESVQAAHQRDSSVMINYETLNAIKPTPGIPDMPGRAKDQNVLKRSTELGRRKEVSSSQIPGHSKEPAEWEEAAHLFELARSGISAGALEHASNRETVFLQNAKVHDNGQSGKEVGLEAFERQENGKKTNVGREAHRKKDLNENREQIGNDGKQKAGKVDHRQKEHEKEDKTSINVASWQNKTSIRLESAQDLMKYKSLGKIETQMSEFHVRHGTELREDRKHLKEERERVRNEDFEEVCSMVDNGRTRNQAFDLEKRRRGAAAELEEIRDSGMMTFEGTRNDWEKEEADEKEEKEKRLEAALQEQEEEKKMKEHQELKEKGRLKEAREKEESERRMRKVFEKQEKDRRLREAYEQEENDRRLKEALEKEEKDKRLREAREQEESERRQREALEKEENDRRLTVALEQEENERRLREALEKEENDRRLRVALELEENERRLKEALEKEENDRRLRAALEQEENERRLKEVALEKEENDRRLRAALEQEENERRLKEVALEKEENDRRLRAALDQEENERRLKEALKKEEKDRKLREACEQEENERRLKEALEKEEKEKMLREALEREEKEKKLKEALEIDKNEKRQVEARQREESGKALRTSSGRETTKNGLDKSRAIESNEKCMEEAFDLPESHKVPMDVQEEEIKASSDEEVLQEQMDSVLKDNIEFEVINDTLHEVSDVGELSGLTENHKQALKDQMWKQDSNKNICSDAVSRKCVENLENWKTEEESTQEGNIFLRNDLDSEKKPMAAENRKLSEDERGEVKGNIKLTSTQAANEGGNGRQRTESSRPDLLNLQKTAQQQNASHLGVWKEKNANNTTMPASKNAERLRKEQELEKERLRKLEEEREREREREKDRMAVDRATLEARERVYSEARERAERAALERATAEARQKAMMEARQRLEKACAEAQERTFSEKSSTEARLRAERAAVERATAEARERAAERAVAEKATTDRFSAPRYNGMRESSQSSDVRPTLNHGAGSLDSTRYPYSSGYNSTYEAEISERVEVESAQRCRARLERHRRTAERAAKALAEKNMRDLLALREQAERNRLAESLDADVKRWSSGKEGNLRALLSTLQYILGPESGWQPIPLTEVITSAAVKKAYRKATLCVHPDKLQQRGASIQQKYICEKVFDLLKEAWNKFNSEER